MTLEVEFWLTPLRKIVYLVLVLLVSSRIPPSDLSCLAQAGYIIVTGRWLYYFNATTRLPVIWATVQIYDLEPDGYIYPVGNITFTDGDGYFNSGPILNNDGPGEDGLDIVVGVFTTSPAATVINPSTNFYYYNLTTSVWMNRSDGTLNVGDLNTTYSERGAWWIFTWHFGLTRGWYYLSSTVDYDTPSVNCRWPYGDRPRYWTNRTIDLPDWACWWPDIILHEYGHHVMNSVYGYIPPSMETHYMETKSNSTTAWAEGWANFFPLAVFNKQTFILGINATHGILYNLEEPHWCSEGWDDGDEVEGRVAGALLDIYDSHTDGYDVLSLGFQRIWNILSSQTDNTFREFWDAWNASYPHPKSGSQLQEWTNTLMAIFQNSIDYRGPGDVNGDGFVGIDDIVTVAEHFGTRECEPGWDARCEMTGDGYIGMDDIVFVAEHFGNSYDC